MKKCEEANIPFHLKYAIRPHKRDDGIVIGSNTSFLKKHLEILRQIAIENPKFLESCNAPHLLTANLDGWIGIACECNKPFTSYTQNMLDIFDIAFKKFLIKNPEISKEIEADEVLSHYRENQEINKDILSYDEKQREKSEKKLSSLLFLNDIKSKNLIFAASLIDNKKIEELYNIFLNECKYEELDLENPAFKKGTKSQLIAIDEDEKGLTEEYVIKIAKEIEVAREKYEAQLKIKNLTPEIIYDDKYFDK